MSFVKTIAAFSAAIMLLSAAPSQAVPLPNAPSFTTPDIANTVDTITYGGAGTDLTVSGMSTLFNDGVGGLELLLGSFNLVINALTVTTGGAPDPSFAFSGGSLTVTDISTNTVLSSTDLSAIGIDSSAASGQLQVLFTNLGGTKAPDYQAQSPLALVLLNSNIFNSSFDGSAFSVTSGNADIGSVAVPLPASGWLLLSAFGGMVWLRRRKMAVEAAA